MYRASDHNFLQTHCTVISLLGHKAWLKTIKIYPFQRLERGCVQAAGFTNVRFDDSSQPPCYYLFSAPLLLLILEELRTDMIDKNFALLVDTYFISLNLPQRKHAPLIHNKIPETMELNMRLFIWKQTTTPTRSQFEQDMNAVQK